MKVIGVNFFETQCISFNYSLSFKLPVLVC